MVTIFAQHEAIQSFENLSLPLRAGNTSVSCVAYLSQMFWPARLAVVYPFPTGGIGVSNVVLSLVLLAGISMGVFILRRRRPYLLTGWLWFLGMLVPVIGFIQVGSQAWADRYTYLPQIGLYLALTWAVADLCAGWRHRRLMLGGFSAIILVALIFCARAQTAYWRNSESLWTHALACTSDNFVAEDNLGYILFKKGSVDDAITHYQKALQIKPGYADAHWNFGNALLQQGSVDEAIAHYEQALQIRPGYADAHRNLGNALLQQGNLDEAIAHFQQALQIKPDDAEAHVALGNAFLQKGVVDDAIVHFQQALLIEPDNAEARCYLGNALLKIGNVDEAVSQFQKALDIKSDYADAQFNLGTALFRKGNVDEAITHFQKALDIKPGFAEAHLNLGSALLQKGKVDEAIIHFQKALDIKPDYLAAQNNLAWLLATSPQVSVRNGSRAAELGPTSRSVLRRKERNWHSRHASPPPMPRQDGLATLQ